MQVRALSLLFQIRFFLLIKIGVVGCFFKLFSHCYDDCLPCHPRLRKGRSPKGNTPKKAKAAAVVPLEAALLLLAPSSSSPSAASRLVPCLLSPTRKEVDVDEEDEAASAPCPNAASAAAAAQRSCALDRIGAADAVAEDEAEMEEEEANGTAVFFAVAALGAGSISGGHLFVAATSSLPTTPAAEEATSPNSTAEHKTPA